jgi:hypothetical protein
VENDRDVPIVQPGFVVPSHPKLYQAATSLAQSLAQNSQAVELL